MKTFDVEAQRVRGIAEDLRKDADAIGEGEPLALMRKAQLIAAACDLDHSAAKLYGHDATTQQAALMELAKKQMLEAEKHRAESAAAALAMPAGAPAASKKN